MVVDALPLHLPARGEELILKFRKGNWVHWYRLYRATAAADAGGEEKNDYRQPQPNKALW